MQVLQDFDQHMIIQLNAIPFNILLITSVFKIMNSKSSYQFILEIKTINLTIQCLTEIEFKKLHLHYKQHTDINK